MRMLRQYVLPADEKFEANSKTDFPQASICIRYMKIAELW